MIDCRYMQWLRTAVAVSIRCGCRGGFGVALMRYGVAASGQSWTMLLAVTHWILSYELTLVVDD